MAKFQYLGVGIWKLETLMGSKLFAQFVRPPLDLLNII